MSNSKSNSQWWRSLRVTIGVLFPAMVILATGVILFISSHFATQNMQDVSRDTVRQMSERAQQRVTSYLEEPRKAVETLAWFFEQDHLDPANQSQLERCFFDLIKNYESVTGFLYGDESGNFLMVTRRNGSLWTRVVTQVNGSAIRIWRKPGPGAHVDEFPDPRIIVPRERPWFNGAKNTTGISWTDPYSFDSSQKPGVTVSISIPGRGVLAADVSLEALSTFITTLRITENGKAFLVDAQGRLLASPHLPDITRPSDVRDLRLVWDSELPQLAQFADMPPIRKAIERAVDEQVDEGADSDEGSFFDVPDVGSFFGAISPIDVPASDWHWSLIVLAPEVDFLGKWNSQRDRQLLTALFFAFMALVASLLMARWINGSLRTLAGECNKIRGLDLTGSRLSSPFKEIDDVLSSFENMKTGLRAFDKYMPSELVRTLLEKGEEAKLGAEERELTILFTDIASFTTISEKLSPMTLATHLGRYHGELSRVIESRRGTVVQYVGDCLVAFWNAPLDVQTHAADACAAALACQATVEQLTRDAPEIPCFATRIGIHTAVVAVGNFGSPERLIYTSIGDGMNLTSRLEGTNKVYGTRVIVSDDTLKHVTDRFETRRLDLVVVKGRENPISIHELLGEKERVPESHLEARDLYEEGLARYVNRDWEGAIELLNAAQALRSDDKAASVLKKRCREYCQSPPPESWRGACIMKTK